MRLVTPTYTALSAYLLIPIIIVRTMGQLMIKITLELTPFLTPDLTPEITPNYVN